MNEREIPPAVVAGVDGSSGARAALVWAVEAAARRRVPLRIVHGTGPAAGDGDRVRAAHGLLTESAGYARRARPDIEVVTVLAAEHAPAVLLGEARAGDVIAVGSRGLGPVRALLLGSAAVRASAHAPCPAVVVPDTGPRGYRGRIVVGVDGSPPSRRALRFALREALATGASVTVVHARGTGAPAAGTASGRGPGDVVAGELAEAVDGRTAHLDVEAVRVEGDPVQALLEAGADADMIVVGSRGRGGVHGLVLGSVGQGVLNRAGVPVAVLPPRAGETGAGPAGPGNRARRSPDRWP
ncbi:universal stress protein [Nocardiopsis flavescens]|uniref:universal stress protein n=1 Tax=Nocardiopsis flavescens TaxID=758803 RepID=UPI003666D951